MSVSPRYIVPNFFTGINFLLGFFSILLAAAFYHPDLNLDRTFVGKAPLILSAWFVVWCTNLDKLDGFAAKLMNASSDFGAQFDSLADLVAFGLAPAFLSFFYLQNVNPSWFKHPINLMGLLVALTIYVLCAALRLARYNSKDADELGPYFMGLPSTFSGGFVCLSLILYDKYELYQVKALNNALPLILITCGILMISPLYLPKLVKRKTKWINMIQYPWIVVGYVLSFCMTAPEFLIASLFTYGLIGFSFCYLQKGTIQLGSEVSDDSASSKN